MERRGEPGEAPRPEIGFAAAFPGTGDYRLFLDFKHGDVVRTAEFTVSLDSNHQPVPSNAPAEPAPTVVQSGRGHGH